MSRAVDVADAEHVAWFDTPVGVLRASASDTALRSLKFTKATTAPFSTPTTLLAQVERELAEYFAGSRRVFEVPLELVGTPFQKTVWNALLGIEYGDRISYLEQSRRVGDEKAIRAVAQANGQNPIVILVPCHRVVSADGGLGGFGGGLLRKQYLLDLERGDRLL
jgi:methylated-DNA-[protein]-cysteine S-methyltransferase